MELFPRTYDEENTGWENKACEILADEIGKDVFDDVLQDQFKVSIMVVPYLVLDPFQVHLF